jgi:hypothetical protein
MPQSDLREFIENGDATLRALLIGVNDYEHLNNLRYAVNDCQVFAQAIGESTQEFKDQPQLYVHCDGQEHGLTSEAIYGSLKRLETNARPQDIFLFYFSGHGAISKKTGELYLCLPGTDPHNIDDTGLNVSTLLNSFNNLSIRHQIVILDACHSGHIVSRDSNRGAKDIGDFPRSVGGSNPEGEEDEEEEGEDKAKDKEEGEKEQQDDNGKGKGDEEDGLKADITSSLDDALQSYGNRSYQQKRDFFALLSCAPDQVSWELENYQHGAFTYNLIQGLREKESADPDGFVTIARLAEYVCKHTNATVNQLRKREQTPRKVAFTGLDIVFGKQSLKACIDRRASLVERENYYRNEYEMVLRQYYLPVPSEVREKLDQLSQEILVPEPKGFEELLERYYRSFVDRYVESITRHIEQKGIPAHHELRKLRQLSGLAEIGMSNDVLRRLEDQVIHPFVDEYRQQYRFALHCYGLKLPLAENCALEDCRERLMLGEDEAQRIAIEEKALLKRHCEQFEANMKVELYAHGVSALNKINLEKYQTTPPLGDILVEDTVQRQRTQFEHTIRELTENIRNHLYQVGRLTIDQVRELVYRFEIGEEVMQSIIDSEEQALDENIQMFRKDIYDHLCDSGQLSSEDIFRFQFMYKLGDTLVKPIVMEVQQEYDNAVKSVMQEYYQYLLNKGDDGV